MAMNWIKMRDDLHEDPSVLAMARELDTRPEHIVGYCHRFWGWVSRNCNADSVTNVTLESLEGVLNLPGFCDMLVKVHWLEYVIEDGVPLIRIPNFERHLSQGAKRRALAAERQRQKRENCHADVTNVSRANRDKIVTREEKRREEKILSNKAAPYVAEESKISGGKNKTAAALSPVTVLGYWNEIFSSKCRMSKKRRAAIQLRLRDDWWLANWAEAMRKVSQSRFCMGGGDTGWVADIDWFVRPDTVTKIMEGKYDDRAAGGTNQRHVAPNAFTRAQDRERAQFAAIAEFLGAETSPDQPAAVRRIDCTPGRKQAVGHADGEPAQGVVHVTQPVLGQDSAASDAKRDLPF